MAIQTHNFPQFNIKNGGATITTDKVSWTQILEKTGVDRRFSWVAVANDDLADSIMLSPNADGSHAITLQGTTVLAEELKYCNNAWYVQVKATSVAATIDIVVWENDK
jgi:hypothetical protein